MDPMLERVDKELAELTSKMGLTPKQAKCLPAALLCASQDTKMSLEEIIQACREIPEICESLADMCRTTADYLAEKERGPTILPTDN